MAGTSIPNFSEMEIQVLLHEVGKNDYDIFKAEKCCHKQQVLESLGDYLMLFFIIILIIAPSLTPTVFGNLAIS
jgi:hypothetical protein